MKLLLPIACLVPMLSACATLDRPVYRPGVPTLEDPNPAPVKVIDDDGTEYTVGEAIADALESDGAQAVASGAGALGGPMAPLVVLAGMLGLGGAAASLRKRHPGAKV